MKWRVERRPVVPDGLNARRGFTHYSDIVEARHVEVGCMGGLLIYGDASMPIKIYAPGQWTTVERVEEE